MTHDIPRRAVPSRRELVASMAGGAAASAWPPAGGGALHHTNLSGRPAVVTPAGFRANGTPTARILVGRLFDEARLLAVAERFQRATDWHRHSPEPL